MYRARTATLALKRLSAKVNSFFFHQNCFIWKYINYIYLFFIIYRASLVIAFLMVLDLCLLFQRKLMIYNIYIYLNFDMFYLDIFSTKIFIL